MYKIRYRTIVLLLIFALTFLYAQYRILEDVSKPGEARPEVSNA